MRRRLPKKTLPWIFHLITWLAVGGVATPVCAATTRLKDLVHVRGIRSNHLNGFGLVIGLKGTGDSKKSLATNKAVANMLTRMGLKTTAEEVVSGNMAAVIATTEMPPFAHGGDLLDVKVSALGDAKSLAGGTLLLTPLTTVTGDLYAVAQGPVVVGQASGSGAQILTVARVPQGASIEREYTPKLDANGVLTLSLIQPDFTTSSRIAEVINRKLKGFFAEARDISGVTVQIPPSFESRLVEFVAEIENLTVEADARSIVVLNERTGTVVMGQKVTIAPVSIAHGDLSIRIGDQKSAGPKQKTVVDVTGPSVGDLIDTLNGLGVKPADLVGILQSLHAAGALKAELRFM